MSKGVLLSKVLAFFGPALQSLTDSRGGNAIAQRLGVGTNWRLDMKVLWLHQHVYQGIPTMQELVEKFGFRDLNGSDVKVATRVEPRIDCERSSPRS